MKKKRAEKAIKKSEDMNNKLYHGEPSILLYKQINESTKLDIINERIRELMEPQQPVNVPISISKYDKTTSENFTTKIWFKVGLLFANGEMDLLLKKHNNVYTQIAKELNNTSYRPYISDTFGTNTTSGKNIYNDKKKIRIIYDHCIKEKIKITDHFLRKYNAIID